jgi:hypothetical protein
VLVEEIAQAGDILGVQWHDIGSGDLPGLRRADADHLAGIAALEISESVVANHA